MALGRLGECSGCGSYNICYCSRYGGGTGAGWLDGWGQATLNTPDRTPPCCISSVTWQIVSIWLSLRKSEKLLCFKIFSYLVFAPNCSTGNLEAFVEFCILGAVPAVLPGPPTYPGYRPFTGPAQDSCWAQVLETKEEKLDLERPSCNHKNTIQPWDCFPRPWSKYRAR